MLIEAQEREESRIAVLSEGVLEELYIERSSQTQTLGNIYKGRVVNVEPALQAAFVNIGLEKNAFLHASDILLDRAGQIPLLGVEPTTGEVRRQDSIDIERALRPNQEILVQVTREPVGNKGPSVTTDISLPGRFLVLMPGSSHIGVSRKIVDETERERLKKLIHQIEIPANVGCIVRTAAEGITKRDLIHDLRYLTKLWEATVPTIKSQPAPCLVYQESDLVTRTIRDLFSPEIEEVLVDSEEVHDKARDFFMAIQPGYARRLKLYKGNVPLFHKYRVEEQIELAYKRRIYLPSGGSIVIDQTEAMATIDVNSGRLTEEQDPEELAFRTNIEAVPEIARQIRLRDLGGLIVIDFIDMRTAEHRRKVEGAMLSALRRDRTRTRALRMSAFCLVQITRQKIGPGLRGAIFQRCPSCDGTGYVKRLESTAHFALRRIAFALNRKGLEALEVRAFPTVALYLLNERRTRLAELENQYGKRVTIIADSSLRPDAVEFYSAAPDGQKTLLWGPSSSEH